MKHPVFIFFKMVVYQDNIYQRRETGCKSRLYLISFNHTTGLYTLGLNGATNSKPVLILKFDHERVPGRSVHGFLKKTRKTPNKDAKIAMENFERLKNNIKVTQLPLTKYSF